MGDQPAASTQDRSTAWEPYLKRVIGPGEKLTPGAVVPCTIPGLPSGTLFRAGETLRLEISGQYRGGEDVPTPHAYGEHRNSGTCFVHTGGPFNSHLLVPTVEAR